ncbi:hypothetical protein COW46_01065 [Candidatus Gracilibacteria bacterium CG17_big_fil_post_rev_8_21_14_2_50_48_13]|nr:MAG: hypothetical protein COW46_01065 [Candidatus Gracilibacteria bacterium CG17_big_fil_post_rev_8_21_14_2_50_48_13]
MLITDRVVWENLMHSFRQEGVRLAVISDFDYTLTAFTHEDGRRVYSSVGCVREMEETTLRYRREAAALYEQFIHFDIDPLLSFEERAEKMHEWWSRHYQLMFSEGISQDLLFRAGSEAGFFRLREGARDLMHFCAQADIPFITLSAGLGEVIRGFYTKEDLYHMTDIVSNFFLYDEVGRSFDISAPIMHNYNKHTTKRLLDAPRLANLRPTHCLVLGDSVGDSKMAHMFPDAMVLRIGILGDHQAHMLPEYQTYFDAILFGNGSLRPVQEILLDARAPMNSSLSFHAPAQVHLPAETEKNRA